MRNGTPLHELERQKQEAETIINTLFPIVGAKIYPGGMELIRESITERASVNRGKRKKITGLSKRSLNKLAFTVFTSSVEFTSILTLTYGTPPPTRGNIIKKQLKLFLQDMYRRFGSFKYCWWLEFQTKRDAPHFHLLTTLPGPSREDLHTFGRLWAKWAFLHTEMLPDEYTKVYNVHSFEALPGTKKRQAWEAIRKKDGAKWYILKYAAKYEQKAVPRNFADVGRFWGLSGSARNRDFNEVAASEEEIRDYLNSKALSVTKREVLPKFILIPK